MTARDSVLTLLFSNAVVISFAVTQQWSLPSVLWVYWFQSVAIGVVAVVRILRLTDFSTDRYKVNNVQPPPTVSTQRQAAFNFAVIYGIFHFAYLHVILAFERGEFGPVDPVPVDMRWIYLASLIFLINHAVAYAKTESATRAKQNIGTIFFYPFLRIIPMHLMPFFSTSVMDALPFFLVLKTAADVGMELVEQRIYRNHR